MKKTFQYTHNDSISVHWFFSLSQGLKIKHTIKFSEAQNRSSILSIHPHCIIWLLICVKKYRVSIKCNLVIVNIKLILYKRWQTKRL